MKGRNGEPGRDIIEGNYLLHNYSQTLFFLNNTFKGQSGAKGQKGNKGERGSLGLPGVAGLPGVEGPQGVDGAKGSPGQMGLNGWKVHMCNVHYPATKLH